MIRRALSLLHVEIAGVHQAAFILAGFALTSSLLAVVRDRVFAHVFGAGTIMDLYFASFRIPDIFFVVSASLVSTYALIPLLTTRDEEGRKQAFESIFIVFSFFAVGAALVLMFFVPQLLAFLYRGEFTSNQDSLVLLTRLLLLQPVLLGMSNIFGSLTQLRSRYILFALSPIVYNIGILSGALFLYPRMGIQGLGVGVLLGAFLHMCLQWSFAYSEGYLRTLPHKISLQPFMQAASISLPRSLALSFGQVSMLILAGLTSLMPAGSLSIFMFAFNLQSVPLSVIGSSYSVAAFPTLAKLAGEGSLAELRERIVSISKHILLWSIPAALLLVVLRAHVVRTVLGSGQFDWTATRLTSASLALFALSIPLQALALLLMRSCYALGESRWPLIASGTAAFATVSSALALPYIFNSTPMVRLFLESLMRVQEGDGIVALTLPLAYGIGSVVLVLVLVLHLSHRLESYALHIRRAVVVIGGASILGAAVAYGMLRVMGDIAQSSTFLNIITQGAVAGTLGFCTFLGILWALKYPELLELVHALHTRVWRVSPVASVEE
jgi:putative peptidoglycan lipid II flippase